MNKEAAYSRLQMGASAPNLVVTGVRNQPVNLADLWTNGPTLLTFLRHFG
jgi:hypothetical protein